MSERVGAGAGAPDEKAPEAAPTAAGTTATAGAAAPDALALLDGLLPEQRRVVTTLDRPVFVAAGAGSGKTFTLTRRIVWALCPGSGEGGRPYLDSLDQALVITFTEKAAGEIKERVRGALRAAGLADEALKVDSAWVSTIHHMCARILRAHALDLGLDPAFGMVGDQQAQALRGRAIEAALVELKDEPALASLFEAYPASAGPLGCRGACGGGGPVPPQRKPLAGQGAQPVLQGRPGRARSCPRRACPCLRPGTRGPAHAPRLPCGRALRGR